MSIFYVLLSVLQFSIFCQEDEAAKPKFVISWVMFTGWVPLDYAAFAGILKKYADAENIEIELLEEPNSINTITKFTKREIAGFAGQVNDLVSLSRFETEDTDPLQPVVIFSGSLSEGADAIISKFSNSVQDLKGQNVYLELESISKYLLYRALQINGLTLDDINMINAPLSEQFDSYKNGSIENLVSFNPLIKQLQKQFGGNIVFTSKWTPREIVDVMVLHKEILDEFPGLGRALSAAFFEVMDLMKDQTADSEIMQWMGARQNSSAEQFIADLQGVKLFYDPQDCVEYLSSEQLGQVMGGSLAYAFNTGLLNEINVKLYFDDSFCLNEAEIRT